MGAGRARPLKEALPQGTPTNRFCGDTRLCSTTHTSQIPPAPGGQSFYDFNGTASSRTPHIGRQNSHTCCARRLQHLAHSLQMPRQLRFWMPSSPAIQHKKDKGCTLPPALYTSNHYFNGFFSHPSLLRELFKDVDPIKQSQLIPTKKKPSDGCMERK